MLFSSALLSFALVGSTSVFKLAVSTPPHSLKECYAAIYGKDRSDRIYELLTQPLPRSKSKYEGQPLTAALSERTLRGDWLPMPCPVDLVCNFPNCACTQESHKLYSIVLTS